MPGTNLHHAYVVVTDPVTGEQFATRAGTGANGGPEGAKKHNIYAQSGNFDETFVDAPSKTVHTQGVGRVDANFAEVKNHMINYAAGVNAAKIPYQLPGGFGRWNSNAYAFSYLRNIGFDINPSVHAPLARNDFNHRL